MTIIGSPGGQFSFSATLTRNQLIEMAYKDAGVLAENEVLTPQLIIDGVYKLNSLIREIDAAGKWLWVENHFSIKLVAGQAVYETTTGLPNDIRQIDRVSYRDENAKDYPVEIITRDTYEAITEKVSTGDPQCVWLTNTVPVGSQILYVWPQIKETVEQSEAIGTNLLNYQCIRSHTADSTNSPGAGANWKMYWQQAGPGGQAWVTGTAYTGPKQLIVWYRRPLFDFVDPGDNPDMPTQWTRLLEYRLASDLADLHGVPLEERAVLESKARGAYGDIFQSLKPHTQDYHNKAKYM